jgi:hypothetical protein
MQNRLVFNDGPAEWVTTDKGRAYGEGIVKGGSRRIYGRLAVKDSGVFVYNIQPMRIVEYEEDIKRKRVKMDRVRKREESNPDFNISMKKAREEVLDEMCRIWDGDDDDWGCKFGDIPPNQWLDEDYDFDDDDLIDDVKEELEREQKDRDAEYDEYVGDDDVWLDDGPV